MTDIAKLTVKMEAESAKLHRDLDKANKKLGKFEKRAKSAGKALKNFAKVGAGAMVVVTAGALKMTKNVMDAADRIGKLHIATGISTESLSRLGYMAELTGANFDTLVKGFRKLQRSMYDSNEGL
ncbi:MAG: hypothetical protein GY938_22715, partial [Ketobacter sp.]|nr:hypothetical protein [Ketobacter sp.]